MYPPSLITIVCVSLVLTGLIELSLSSKNHGEIWDDYPKWNLIESDNKYVQKTRCKDGKCTPNFDFLDIVRRSPNKLVLAGKKDKKVPTSYLPTCSCAMEQSIVDLGNHYYPRYLLTAICKGESCWMGPYKCKPTQYKVKVLKRKTQEEDGFNSSLPSSLKEEWVSEIVTVNVACECSP